MDELKMAIYMMIGFPASTKSTYANKLYNKLNKKPVILSRDKEGNQIKDLLPKVEELIKQNNIVILDNTHITKKSREPFIKLAEKYKIPIYGIYIKTSIEECQIRLLDRMWKNYDTIYFTGKPQKGSDASNDPGVFPPAVLFSARKQLEEPVIIEGFSDLVTIPVKYPTFNKNSFKNKALFLDIDGTVRKMIDGPIKYPIIPDQVELLFDAKTMKDLLDSYIKNHYILIGISNQSGIAQKKVSEKAVIDCFNRTRELLGYTEKEFEILYCPHSPVPIQCYCRKPQVGMAMYAIEKYKLDPSKCIMIGDRKTDKTMAERLKMVYKDQKDFWNQ
jgi:histidinol-phosphate phosphatase family protein